MVKFSRSKGYYKKRMQEHIINERIRSNQLRVIDGEENLGVISKDEALRIAHSKNKDLVIIAEQANPPVAKILDYTKFLYEEKKKKAAAKAKSKKTEVKELRLSAQIGEGDLLKRAERAIEFIKDGNRVKITLRLKGREAAYPEVALEKINKFSKEIEEYAVPEGKPKVMGKIISVVYLNK